eukprot:ctg_12.g8
MWGAPTSIPRKCALRCEDRPLWAMGQMMSEERCLPSLVGDHRGEARRYRVENLQLGSAVGRAVDPDALVSGIHLKLPPSPACWRMDLAYCPQRHRMKSRTSLRRERLPYFSNLSATLRVASGACMRSVDAKKNRAGNTYALERCATSRWISKTVRFPHCTSDVTAAFALAFFYACPLSLISVACNDPTPPPAIRVSMHSAVTVHARGPIENVAVIHRTCATTTWAWTTRATVLGLAPHEACALDREFPPPRVAAHPGAGGAGRLVLRLLFQSTAGVRSVGAQCTCSEHLAHRLGLGSGHRAVLPDRLRSGRVLESSIAGLLHIAVAGGDHVALDHLQCLFRHPHHHAGDAPNTGIGNGCTERGLAGGGCRESQCQKQAPHRGEDHRTDRDGGLDSGRRDHRPRLCGGRLQGDTGGGATDTCETTSLVALDRSKDALAIAWGVALLGELLVALALLAGAGVSVVGVVRVSIPIGIAQATIAGGHAAVRRGVLGGVCRATDGAARVGLLVAVPSAASGANAHSPRLPVVCGRHRLG